MQAGSSIHVKFCALLLRICGKLPRESLLLYLLLSSLIEKKEVVKIQVLARVYDFLDNYFFCKRMGNILTMLCALRIFSFPNYSFGKIGRRGADKLPKANVSAVEGRKLERKWAVLYMIGYLSMLSRQW